MNIKIGAKDLQQHTESIINDQIKNIYIQILALNPSHPSFLHQVQLLQEEIFKIADFKSLTRDQKKILQLELSCIEDHITIINLSKEIEQTSIPSKNLFVQEKYTRDDISFCLQNLHSIFFNP